MAKSKSTQTAKRPKIYYGWYIVLVAGLASISQTSYYGPVISSFMRPITGEFNWTRSQFVGAISAGGILGGIASIFIGPLLDKYGSKWIMFIGSAIMGAMLIATSFIHGIAQFYAITITAQVALSSMVTLGITTVIPKWFVRRRGIALAVTNIGTRIGVGINPLWVQAVIGGYGWRTGMVALGLMTWSITLLPTLFFMKRQPEDMGLRPDGDTPESNALRQNNTNSKRRKVSADSERSFTLKEVLRLPSFYLLLLSFCIAFFAGSGILVHLLPLLTDRGLSTSQAALVLTTWSGLGVIGSLVGGFLNDRFEVRYVAAGVYASLAVGTFILAHVHGLAMAYTFAVVHGVVWGAWNNIQIMIFADYYGRRSLGSIRGFVAPVQTATSALAPLAVAAAFDASGSYTTIITVFVGMMILAGVVMLFTRAPQAKASA